MKLVLILAACVASTYAGVGVVTPEIEAKALALWAKFCEGASEGGNDEGALIYCKKSQDKIEESLTHEHELTSNPSTSEQVVFVQPPSYHYKHDVILNGKAASGQNTIIYVKPAKNTHEVNVEDKTTGGAEPQKPTLYFLKGNHGGPEGDQAGTRSRRHHAPGHEGHGDETQASPGFINAAPLAEESDASAVAPVSQKPVVYILKMRN